MTFWSAARPPAQQGALRRCRLRAFGQEVEILHRETTLEQQHRCQDLQQIYALFLASRVLPKTGTCLDIGAGAGWFGLSFAAAFPRWQVLCLETDAARFEALRATLSHSGLKNIRALQGGFHPGSTPVDLPKKPIKQSLKKGDSARWPDETLWAVLQQAAPLPFCSLSGLGDILAPAETASGGEHQSSPGFDPTLLGALAPDLVKLEAPGVEAPLAEALRHSPTGFVTGRLFSAVPSADLMPADPEVARQIYLPHGPLVLRRDFEERLAGRRPGLDLVVALYNGRAFIEDCLDSLLAQDNPEIRVLVVDDGSTDGSGDLVAARYGDHPRLTLLRKANGGCASARNYGRAHSDATHIGFFDADDRVDPALFSHLLELARYTGFNMVEGEFLLFEEGGCGQEQRQPSYEAERFAAGPERRLGEIAYCLRPSLELMQGQPSIWRRIYRRDFLDHWQIDFPEHVRAFDDQIFQLLCAQHGGEMAHLFGPSYHYRQHEAQDIKQGDARHFYSFNMYRQVFLRATREAWPDLAPVLGSLVNTLNWSYASLPPALKEIYCAAAVEFLAMLGQGFGPDLLEVVDLERSGIEGLGFLVQRRLRQMSELPQNHGVLHLEDWRWQPEFIAMQAAAQETPHEGPQAPSDPEAADPARA
ncbi:glycosyltransferase [Pseudophaeobacter sp.]|uniref:glycosyltransferase n=1 Tax=Pseudophaeobacter sp. TaxID=1971739 RepID=UPI003296C40A